MKGLFLIFSFFLFENAFGEFSQESYSMGLRSSYATNLDKTQNSLLYYQIEYESELLNEDYTLKKNFKIRVFDFIDSDEEVLIDPFDISYEWLKNDYTFQVGFLRYRFSESFGVQLLDVANPRDYSEFIFNDLAWSKRAVFGLNTSFKLNDVWAQLFLTLWPGGDRLPYKHSYYATTPKGVEYEGGVYDKGWFNDLEYGVRFSKLFENSLSLSFLYYHHQQRPLSLKSEFSNSSLRLSPNFHMVDSYGGSFSYLLKEFVIRGDLLLTINDRDSHYQSLLGIDKIFSSFNLGFQTLKDYSFAHHFLGLKWEWTGHSLWTPSVLIFNDIESSDRWLQYKNDFYLDKWLLSLSFDHIEGKDDGLFGVYKDNDRFLLDVLVRY